ncbi:MAG: glycosyltransferase, partial [Flavobacteriaceae bacterium]|nr:glycosyltransferase [Flavobacteriaceae bacterium]
MKERQKITAIIPTFNEELNIEAAIKSVDFADEIIVIDSFSTDNTVALAKKHEVRLLQRKFDDFSSQKNYAINKVKYDWVFVLDADERISLVLKEEIKNTLKKQKDEVAYWVCRTNIYMNKEIKYSGWQNDKAIRLFKKEFCKYNGKLVHEKIVAKGKTGVLENKIKHYSYKGIDAMILKRNRYAQFQAEMLFEKGKKPNMYHFVLKPLLRFVKHYIIQLGFLDGYRGLIIS